MQASKDGFVVRKAELSDLTVKSRVSQAHAISRQMQRLEMQRIGATRPGIAHEPIMRKPAPKPIAKRISLTDHFVVTVGIAMAAASASFATYMVSTDHSHPVFNGSEHLMIFAQPSHTTPNPLIGRVPGAPANDQGIDYTATGAIPGQPNVPTPPRHTIPSVNAPEGAILSEFTLRGVSGKVAMIEGPDGMYRLEVGADMPGGGRVLSIEWLSGRFVVVTTRGIIREAQP